MPSPTCLHKGTWTGMLVTPAASFPLVGVPTCALTGLVESRVLDYQLLTNPKSSWSLVDTALPDLVVPFSCPKIPVRVRENTDLQGW